jgi:succinoglycan biosynthesis transport protein ExoP
MELRLYLDILKRRAWVILIVTVVAVAVVVAASFLIPPTYTASTTVRVLLDVGLSDFVLREDYSTRLLNTYAEILTSRPVLEETLDRLSPRTDALSADELRERVLVEIVPNTELISISVQDRDPALARDMANTLSALLIEYAQDIYLGTSKSTREIVQEQLAAMENELESDRRRLEQLLVDGGNETEVGALNRQIEFKEDAYDRLLDRYELARLNESLRANSIAVIGSAMLPRTPSQAIGLTELALALVVGLFGGIGLALVMENLDTRVHSPQQLEHLANIPILGAVPRGRLPLDNPANSSGHSQPIKEAYRLLAINLQALDGGVASLQTLLITSATPNEGKSTVAVNLAQVLAEQGQKVFLLESDMRRSSLGKTFGIEDGLTLSTLLSEHASLYEVEFDQVYRPVAQPWLPVLPGGPAVPRPAALLDSPLMEALLDHLREDGQITLLDAPPVLGVADVSVLAPKVDGVVLVVRQSFSTREGVREALKQLKATRAQVLGLIFVQKSKNGRGY